MPIIYGSVCSGIGAESVAWAALSWHTAWFAEIEPFCSAVLKHRFPDVPNLGDFTRIGVDVDCKPIDLLVGGTPCQSFSVAGGRAGLDDPRGVLALEYLALAGRLRPRWLVFENVPGLLSSWSGADETGALHEGQEQWEDTETSDFSLFLAALSELGYGWAYRSLDAQYFELAQRRERVILVGFLGDWRPPAAVLFERASLCGHSPPRREAGARVANCVTPSARVRNSGEDEYVVMDSLSEEAYQCQGSNVGRMGTLRRGSGSVSGGVPFALTGLGNYSPAGLPSLRAAGGDCGGGSESLLVFDWQAGGSGDTSFRGKSRSYVVRKGEYTGAVQATKRDALCIQEGRTGIRAYPTVGTLRSNAPGTQPMGSLVAQTLTASYAKSAESGGNNCQPVNVVEYDTVVRCLTPREVERLQGVPDDWTLVPYRGRPAKAGPRYRALGNAMAVPVMHWVGERIAMVEALLHNLGSNGTVAG